MSLGKGLPSVRMCGRREGEEEEDDDDNDDDDKAFEVVADDEAAAAAFAAWIAALDFVSFFFEDWNIVAIARARMRTGMRRDLVRWRNGR